MSTLFKRSSSQQQDEMLEMVIRASRKQWQCQHQGPLSKLTFLTTLQDRGKPALEQRLRVFPLANMQVDRLRFSVRAGILAVSRVTS
jgi:hypothetical protein